MQKRLKILTIILLTLISLIVLYASFMYILQPKFVWTASAEEARKAYSKYMDPGFLMIHCTTAQDQGVWIEKLNFKWTFDTHCTN